jgi:hypothetical protein
LGETRVDLVHLLEDLRDAYPGSLEETILTEIVANALDSGARLLELHTDSAERSLIARDNGTGMTRRELSRYHDLASSTKRRGSGIGFAGVGIKLGLLACDEVITETRRTRQHHATSWRLANRSRAPWSWIEPQHLLEHDGTAVLLRLSNPLSLLLDAGFIETTILRQFQPLFEPEFVDLLAPAYPHGFAFTINDRVVVGPIRPAQRYPLGIRVGRQRKPSGVGYLARHDAPLPEHERGLAISTLGKVIRRGWDWLGITPADGDRIEGVIEVPALAEALTLNKGDFLRTGNRGALFLSYRKAIQEAVTAQLEAWGSSPPPQQRAPRTKPMERDIQRVLGDLAAEYPLLTTLVERTAGGQRRLPLADGGASDANGLWGGEALHVQQPLRDGAATAPDSTRDDGESSTSSAEEPRRDKRDAVSAAPEPSDVKLPGRARTKKPTLLSLQIRFENRGDDVALARLIESTVWVNDAHPAYKRAVATRAEGYHIALSVAAALAPLAVEAQDAQRFIGAFLARWGAAAPSR